MRSKFKRFRMSPAFPISLLALFVALGGIAGAAATIGTKQLKNNSVTSKKIKNGTIKKGDLGFDATGPAGPAGPAGAIGPAGPAGPAGAGGAFSRTVAASDTSDVTVSGFTLRATADGAGACTRADLFASAPSRFSELRFSGATPLFTASTELAASTPPAGGVQVAGPAGMWEVIARSNGGTSVADFTWTLDTNPAGQCHFAGTAVGN